MRKHFYLCIKLLFQVVETVRDLKQAGIKVNIESIFIVITTITIVITTIFIVFTTITIVIVIICMMIIVRIVIFMTTFRSGC